MSEHAKKTRNKNTNNSFKQKTNFSVVYMYLHSQLSVLSSKVGAFSSTIVQTLQNSIKFYIFQIFFMGPCNNKPVPQCTLYSVHM